MSANKSMTRVRLSMVRPGETFVLTDALGEPEFTVVGLRTERAVVHLTIAGLEDDGEHTLSDGPVFLV